MCPPDRFHTTLVGMFLMGNMIWNPFGVFKLLHLCYLHMYMLDANVEAILDSHEAMCMVMKIKSLFKIKVTNSLKD